MATTNPTASDSIGYDKHVIEHSGNVHYHSDDHRLIRVAGPSDDMFFINDNTDATTATVFFDSVERIKKHALTDPGYKFKRNGVTTCIIRGSELKQSCIELLDAVFVDD